MVLCNFSIIVTCHFFPFFPFLPINDFKVLTRFFEIIFVSLIFQYSSGNIWFYFKKHLIFSSEKKCSLKIALLEFSIFPKLTCLLLAIFLKFLFLIHNSLCESLRVISFPALFTIYHYSFFYTYWTWSKDITRYWLFPYSSKMQLK